MCSRFEETHAASDGRARPCRRCWVLPRSAPVARSKTQRIDPPPRRPCLQAYTYVAIWIGLSGAVIMYNKYLLAYRGFPFPITLTMWCVPAGGRGGCPRVFGCVACPSPPCCYLAPSRRPPDAAAATPLCPPPLPPSTPSRPRCTPTHPPAPAAGTCSSAQRWPSGWSSRGGCRASPWTARHT